MEKLLEIQHMMKYYGNKSSLTKAVNDISFSVEKGEFTAVNGSQRVRKDHAFKLYFHH